MKRIHLLFALPFSILVLTDRVDARDPNGASSKPAASPSPGGPEGEMQYAREMAGKVHDEIALYGSNRRIRSQIKKVDDEISLVNREISSHHFDRDQIRAQVARIDDELHSIDLELRDLRIHEPMTLTGGKESLVH